MEQLNPFYDESISENFFTMEHFNQGLSHTEVNQFMHKLMCTIDLTKLNELFYQQLQVKLHLGALKIQFEDKTLILGDWSKQVNHKTLSCVRNNQIVATLHYGFSRTLSARDWQVLQQMHLYFSNPFKNALEHYKIKQFAMKDFLTSLGNRASYTESLARLFSQAERHHNPFGILVLDLDNFKQVNDKLGHHEGDNVIVAFAQTISHCLRESDFAFRFGGDEFCCLLPDTTAPTLQLIAQRITQAMTEQVLLKNNQVSCSIGSAVYQSQDTADSLFSRADSALYNAKQSGRNCIRAA